MENLNSNRMSCAQNNRMRHLTGKWGWVRSSRGGGKGYRDGDRQASGTDLTQGTVSGSEGWSRGGYSRGPYLSGIAIPHLPEVVHPRFLGEKVCQSQRLAAAENEAPPDGADWAGSAQRGTFASRCMSLPLEWPTHLAIHRPGLWMWGQNQSCLTEHIISNECLF